MPRIFLCAYCDEELETVNDQQLNLFQAQHREKHGINRNSKSLTVSILAPHDPFLTPELTALLNWREHERTRGSKIDLEKKSQSGSDQ